MLWHRAVNGALHMSFSLLNPARRPGVAVVLAALTVVSPAFADEAKQTPFVQSLMANWKQIDADADRTISLTEIDAALKNPAVQGDVAAAVSALKLITRGSKTKLPPLTADYFEKYNAKALGQVKAEAKEDAVDATTDAEGGTRDTAAKPIDSPIKWDKYFRAGQARLKQAGGSQFSSSNFSLGQMKQGPLGDCFFVASLGSVVTHRPEALKSLVVQQPDGSYQATFPGVPTFSVPKLTDSQIAISGTSGEGAFLAVFEQAFGRYRSQLRGKGADVDGTDWLYRGGDSAPTLQQITGHATKRIGFAKTLEAREKKKDQVLPKLRAALVENIAERRAITCGLIASAAQSAEEAKKAAATRPADSTAGTLPITPPAILKNHVYVVVKYDAKTDLVTIWNPHANTFKPKGEPGLTNGYVTERGQFTLPLTEAYQFYGSFTFETTEPAKTPEVKKAEDQTT